MERLLKKAHMPVTVAAHHTRTYYAIVLLTA